MTNPITINSGKTITSILRGGTSIEKMMLAWEWRPQALFLGNEQAASYDPIDVANDDWRRNLLTFTEDFSNAVWTKSSSSITSTSKLDPLGGNTAEEMTSTVAGGTLRYNYTFSSGPHTFSVWLRTSSPITLPIFIVDGAGVATSQSYSVTTEWTRFSVTASATAGTGRVQIADGFFPLGGALEVWGAQLELGSVATPYQRITDVNTEVRALFPNTTMFQDNAGLAPNASASSSQTVGMWLDKSKLLALGPEQFVVASATETSGVVQTGTSNDWVITAAVANNSAIAYDASFATNVGKFYTVQYEVYDYVSGSVAARLQSINGPTASSNGVYRHTHLATAVGNFIGVMTLSTSTLKVRNISVREIPGNHALQTSTSLRPLFGRSPVSRRNLLTRTEDFGNAAWDSRADCTITGGQTDFYFGASAFLVTATANYGRVARVVSGISADSNVYTRSVFVKKGTASSVFLSHHNTATTGYMRFFNLDTLAITGTAGVDSFIDDLGGGWYKIGFSQAATASQFVRFGFGVVTSGESAYFYGAQLELGSVATPYQKVVTALDITEAGKPSYAFMRPDLSDDKLTTNMASTKNLLRYTEEFDNAAWGKSAGVSVSANTVVAPDGTQTADTVSFTAQFAQLLHTVTFAAATYTFSIWAWTASGSRTYSVRHNTSGVELGTITATTTPTRHSFQFTRATSDTSAITFQDRGTSGYVDTYIWGAQLELGATATAYEYGGFKGDVVVAGKNGTAYETNVTSPTGVMDLGPLTYTGGTPGILRAVGDVVGYTMARKKFTDVEKAQLIRYYKKRGAKGILTLGAELVANGGFATDTDWTKDAGWAISGLVAAATAAAVSNELSQAITVVEGSWYQIEVSATITSGSICARLYQSGEFVQSPVLASGSNRFILQSGASGAGSAFTNTIALAPLGTFTGTIDNISVKELRPEEEW